MLSFLGLFWLSSLSLTAPAQQLPPKVTTFSPLEYDAHHQVYCIEILPDGRVAFGTEGKVIVYDGEDFEDVKVGCNVYSLDADSNGRIYVGGRNDLGILRPDRKGALTYRSFRSMVPDSMEIGVIWGTYADPDGKGAYFNAMEKVFYYHDQRLETILPKNRFFLMHPVGDNLIISDWDTALYRLDGARKEALPGSRPLAGRTIRNIFKDPSPPSQKGNAWLLMTEWQGVYRYYPEEGNFGSFPLTSKAKSSFGSNDGDEVYTATRMDPDKNPYGAAFALGTELGGVYLLSEECELLLHLPGGKRLPSKMIWRVRSDRRGNLWVATDRGIALVHTGSPFSMMHAGQGFAGSVLTLDRLASFSKNEGGKRKGGKGHLFLGTSQGTWIWKKGKKRFHRIRETAARCSKMLPFPAPELSSDDTLKASKDLRRSRMLVNGNSSGTFSLTAPAPGKKGWSCDTVFKPPTDAMTRVFFGDTPRRNGAVVAGSQQWVLLLPASAGTKEGWEKRPIGLEFPSGLAEIEFAPALSVGDSLVFWAKAGKRKLFKVRTDTAFTGIRRTRYDSSDGLPPGALGFLTAPDGNNVLFTSDSGLYRYDKGRFLPYGGSVGTFARKVTTPLSLKEGNGGDLWVRTGKGGGIARILPEKNGPLKVDSILFRALDIGKVRTIYPDGDRVWFGGPRGMVSYFPDVKKQLEGNWSCRIEEVRGSGDSLLFGGTFFQGSGRDSAGGKGASFSILDRQPSEMLPTLSYSRNRVHFEYAAPFPDRQDAVEYSYKLEGFDTAWSSWSKKSRKEYTSLPEGAYRFRVKARNIYLKESSSASYRFRILPPWYRTWTAYGGYLLAAGGFFWLLVRLNGRRLLAQKERLERTVQERTQEIREQKEEVEKQKQEVESAHQKLSEAHKEITQSIDYAQKIQHALLRSEEEVSQGSFEHFVLFKPQSQVSGDFYWIKEHRGYLYIAAVDCTGHGIPGAFMSMLGISQLNEIMNTDELLTPGRILTELRDRVVRELSGSDSESSAKDGMDAAIVRIPLSKEQGVRSKEGEGESEKVEAGYEKRHPQGEGFNPRSHEGNEDESTIDVQFAGAQNPLYVVRRGIAEEPASVSVEYHGERSEGDVGPESGPDPIKPFKRSSNGIEIKGDGMPVGYDEYAQGDFSTVELRLRKGDMLYIFSDGYADQFGGPKGKKFRYGPFKELLANFHEKLLEEQKQELDKSFEDWKNESHQEQIDDVLVIGVRL